MTKIIILVLLVAFVGGAVYYGKKEYRKQKYEQLHIAQSEIVVPDEVRLYMRPSCGYSKRAKQFLNERGVQYQECDVDSDSQCNEEFRSLMAPGVPVVVAGDRKIIGFDREAYTYLFQSDNSK